jgi:hypothetical protein
VPAGFEIIAANPQRAALNGERPAAASPLLSFTTSGRWLILTGSAQKLEKPSERARGALRNPADPVVPLLPGG